MTWRVWAPLALFAAFVALAAYQLSQPKDETIASRMVGQSMPQFALEPAVAGKPGLASRDLATGKPQLVNIFASWCLPCAAEAPQLAALQARGVRIVGVAVRDKPENVARFLASYGDPYAAIGRDDISAVQFALGSSGVPETFIVDGKGVIRYQHIGDIRADQVEMILAKLAEAGA